jgi:predicted nucleic acid-binding protein
MDSSFVVRVCAGPVGFEAFGREELVAPAIMWSEFRSAVHESLWRGEIGAPDAERIRSNLRASPIRERRHRRLDEEAWQIAEEMGWAKTYDAEYVALARLLRCRLVTSDERLRRGADRLGFVITPAEL